MSNFQDYFVNEETNLQWRAQCDSNCEKFDLGNSASSQDNKICLICGDKAIRNNFGVTTCDSCKAFFRRYVTKGLDTRCPFDGHCIINVLSRKDCPTYRLQKCLQVGMTSDYAGTRRRRVKNPNCGQSRRRTMVKVEPKKDIEDKEDELSGNTNSSVSSFLPPPPPPPNQGQPDQVVRSIMPHLKKALEGTDVLVTVRVSKSALHRKLECSGGQGGWLDMAALLFGGNHTDNETALTSGGEGDLVKEWISVQIVLSETQPTNIDDQQENRTLLVNDWRHWPGQFPMSQMVVGTE